ILVVSSAGKFCLCRYLDKEKTMETGNLLHHLPTALREEFIQTLVSAKDTRIERIVSKGHCSPPDFWYDQDEHEWVLLLTGAARLQFADLERVVHLTPGTHVTIAAHERHRVEWTTEETETVWLA